MTNQIDHFKEAERLLEDSKNGDNFDDAMRMLMATQAQVHATLALVQAQQPKGD